MRDEQKIGAGPKVGIIVAILVVLGFIVWFTGSSNPVTPAGYVGYLTQDAVFGQTKFLGLQTGPSSPGRTWKARVTNVSVTPNTSTEEFTGENSVLSKDNLKVGFRVHLVWWVDPEGVKQFTEKFSTLYEDQNTDKVLDDAYNNFLKEPLRTFAREEVQTLKGLEIKEKIGEIGSNIFAKVQKIIAGTPFRVSSAVVGNIQYPKEIADEVALKLAATQTLERMQTEIDIEDKKKEKRLKEAEGIADAMNAIQAKLTPQYLQYLAIEAQKAMVGSPNNTVVYIPVGNMGVPITGTFDVDDPRRPK